jgi:asparagine synthase (glutamine-hydrolysing)
MCGIFGMLGRPGTESLARQVVSDLKHRGPDDDGFQLFPEGWLAHTRLSIIDLSPLGRQPMANARGTAWITFNGEIYNYLELRGTLRDYPFRTQTDTEVILAAYERWGPACVRHLRGMFAFGLWDAERKRLLCATDRFSIKPLYYSWDGRRFVFSSEVKPIASSGVPLRLDAEALYDYLAFGLLDHGERTLFDGIAQLRPGTSLVLENGRLSVAPYWSIDADRALEADGEARPDALTDRVETSLLDAVRFHLRGDVEIGLSLSSGLDSTLLRALIGHVRRGPQPLQCFTYSFPDTPYDEWKRGSGGWTDDGCQYHRVELRPAALLDDLQRLIHVMEGPVGGLGIYGYWRNAKQAADCGIKVLLDGQGADETFAGYRYYYEERVRQLWDEGDRDSARDEFARLRRDHGEPAGNVAEWVRTHRPDGGVRAPDSTALTSSYVAPAFAARFSGRPPAFPAPFQDAVKNAMYRDLLFVKIPKLLRFQDRCAMAWGVEVRVPYLDHPLVEQLFAVPTPRLINGGLTKSLMRTIAARHLTGDVLRTPKLYVAAPQREWVKRALRGPLETLIQESVLAERGYVEKATLLQQFRDYVRTSELGNSFFIWKFMNLELWYRTFCTSATTSLASGATTGV